MARYRRLRQVINDVTARAYLSKGRLGNRTRTGCRGRVFPPSCRSGPSSCRKKPSADPYSLSIRLSVNGKIYQDETTADMMISIERQIAFLSDRVILQPGDLICTGFPLMATALPSACISSPAMRWKERLPALGTQRNPCVAETAS